MIREARVAASKGRDELRVERGAVEFLAPTLIGIPTRREPVSDRRRPGWCSRRGERRWWRIESFRRVFQRRERPWIRRCRVFPSSHSECKRPFRRTEKQKKEEIKRTKTANGSAKPLGPKLGRTRRGVVFPSFSPRNEAGSLTHLRFPSSASLARL